MSNEQHEKREENDHARLAPASAIAPENLTNAPGTEANSWQPIETMTLGCVRVLLHCVCDFDAMEDDGDEYCLDGYIVIAEHLKWSVHDPKIPSQSRDGWWTGSRFIPLNHRVTHWMPLPRKPANQKEK